MQIKRLRNTHFGTKKISRVVTGWALYEPGKGWVRTAQTVTSLVFWYHISRAAAREHCRAFWMLAAFAALRAWSTCRSWQRKLPDPERGKDGKQKL